MVQSSDRSALAVVGVFMVTAMAVFARTASQYPVHWSFALAAFFLLALLLAQSSSELRHNVRGSTSFLVVCALAVTSGPTEAGLVTAACVLVVDGLLERRELRKVAFNVAQHTLALLSSWYAYTALGGATPAAFLSGAATGGWLAAALDLARFSVLVLLYLLFNSLAVSIIVSATRHLRFFDVWAGNNRGVLSFDFSSIAISVLGAVSYTFFNQWSGFGVVGLALVAVPMLVSRKSYILLRQLQMSGEELLQLMVKAIEARDPYTSGHSLRVQRLSVAIAGDLRISGRDMENVATAALLHDVGKIHEEFAPVLRKESKLTPEERALIETHAFRGSELVGVISRFRGPVQTAVLHHHERWDGAGYPAQLRGEAIPLISRIILVADTIDAMTTDRPYRARMGFDSVVAELKRHAGTQFDPDIAEVAITSLAVRRIITEPDKTVVREASPAAAAAATAV